LVVEGKKVIQGVAPEFKGKKRVASRGHAPILLDKRKKTRKTGSYQDKTLNAWGKVVELFRTPKQRCGQKGGLMGGRATENTRERKK